MRENPDYALTDPRAVADLIRANPWAAIVSATDRGLVASHYPVLVDEDDDGLWITSHVGRPDERLHGLGSGELLVIVEGPSGRSAWPCSFRIGLPDSIAARLASENSTRWRRNASTAGTSISSSGHSPK